MRKSKLFKGLIVLILIEVLFLAYIGIIGLVIYREKDMEVGTFTYMDCYNALNILRQDINKNHCTMSKDEFREFVEDDLGVHFYIYKEREFKGKYIGKTYHVIRTIVVDNNLEDYDYFVCLAHELMHLKTYIGQEDYICFETFKYLYESEELHDIGVWYAIKQLNGFQGSGEYDIDYHIVNYLTNK